MKIGLNVYAGSINDANLKFARQLGCSHIVAHLLFDKEVDAHRCGYWPYEGLIALRQLIESHGLKLEALENFRLDHWDHVLLDGPRRDQQMAHLKTTIRNMGRAGIPIMGYYFSLAGVWGHVKVPYARGAASSAGYIKDQAPAETPLERGKLWNFDTQSDPPEAPPGSVTREQMWDRLTRFLEELLPVAEEANVKLAAHPDDPPLETLRGTGRLITQPDHYDRLLAVRESPCNGIEFCQGTISEMANRDVYAAIRKYASMGKIFYVHFRNVRGTVPNYYETFLDDGDVDMIEALRIYKECGYDGMLIPDHTPGVTCDAPWHAGMAYALGYMRAALKMLGVKLE